MPSKVRNKEKNAVYQRKHYLANQDYYKNKREARRQRLIVRYADLKQTWCCTICQEDDDATFDLHHYDPSKKGSEIRRMISLGVSWNRIVAEVEKCVCLCANCHRKVHKHESWANKIGPSDLIVVPDDLR